MHELNRKKYKERAMKKKILLVEDSKPTLNLLNNFFSERGFNVQTASNGKEALNIIRKKPIPLVITDIKMPEMDGIELIEKIKSSYPMIKVILTTGFVDFKYGLSAFTNGAETIIFKPFDFEKLISAVDKTFDFLEEWELKLKELQELKSKDDTNPGGNETILFADSDEQVVNFAKFNLEKKGYNFISAKSGKAVIKQQLPDTLDLLITTVKLPDLYGKDLYKMLRDDFPKLKVLYLVSYKEETIFNDNVLHENDDYIYFPFTQKILLNAIRKVLDE